MAKVATKTHRPHIPRATSRRILAEAGYRCAVCGDACPLERAHIIPWCKTRQHKEENLVCLCANCHQRADLEGWGEQALRYFKKNPWILRRKSLGENPSPRVEVRISIDINLATFDERKEHFFQHALASFLDVSPDQIDIVRKEEGSVNLYVRLPARVADTLLESFEKRGVNLRRLLEQPVTSIEVSTADRRDSSDGVVQSGSEVAIPTPGVEVASDAAPADVDQLLVAWSQGDREALDAVFPLVFEDLRRIARKAYSRVPVRDFQPTELIGEIYAVLLKQRAVSIGTREQFYSFAAFLMERVLLRYKRALGTQKRGGQATEVPIIEALDLAAQSEPASRSTRPPTPRRQSPSSEAALKAMGTAVDLAEKLAELATFDPQQADVVRLRYLIGLTQDETAKRLGISIKTVARKWRTAKRFLALELEEYSGE